MVGRLEKSVAGECMNIRETVKRSVSILGENISFIILQYFGASCSKTDTMILRSLFETHGKQNIIAMIWYDTAYINKYITTFGSLSLCPNTFGKIICWSCEKGSIYNQRCRIRCGCHDTHLDKKLITICINWHIIDAYIRVVSNVHKREKINIKDLQIDPDIMLYVIKSVFL